MNLGGTQFNNDIPENALELSSLPLLLSRRFIGTIVILLLENSFKSSFPFSTDLFFSPHHKVGRRYSFVIDSHLENLSNPLWGEKQILNKNTF